MSRPCHVLRVFTREDDGGNHLGVVDDLIELSSGQMQAIAADLGFSETIFVDSADPDTDPVVRIFTPEDELPFAGHPLVGCAWALTTLGSRPSGRIATPVGVVGYSVDGDVVTVEASIEITEIVPDDVAEAVAAARMPEPVSTALLGLPKEYLIAEYADFAIVDGLDPDMDALAGRFGLLAYARDGDRVKSRFFAPGTGVPEDPATGSAAVALAHSFKLRGEMAGAVTVFQGDEIGHPSTIHLTWSDGPTTIGGTVRHDETRLVP